MKAARAQPLSAKSGFKFVPNNIFLAHNGVFLIRGGEPAP